MIEIDERVLDVIVDRILLVIEAEPDDEPDDDGDRWDGLS